MSDGDVGAVIIELVNNLPSKYILPHGSNMELRKFAFDWWQPDKEDIQFLVRSINAVNEIRNLMNEHEAMALLPGRARQTLPDT